MMRVIGTFATCFSVLFFPWPLTVCLALGMALFEPLVPFAAGLFADTIYYAPPGNGAPFFTIAGALVTALSFFVRSRLKTGSIER